MNMKVKYGLFSFALLFLFIGSGVLVYQSLVSDIEINDVSKIETNIIKAESGTKKRVLDEDSILTSNKTILSFEEKNSNEEVKTFNRVIPQEFIGMTKSEIVENYNEWTVTQFSSEEIELERYIELPKPMYILSIEDGEMVIYYKDVNGDITVDEKIGIYTDVLPEADVENLKKGIVYESKEDILKILENYDS